MPSKAVFGIAMAISCTKRAAATPLASLSLLPSICQRLFSTTLASFDSTQGAC